MTAIEAAGALLHDSVDVPADVNARISHLAEGKSAAFERAHAAAGAAAVKYPAGKELLSREIPEGQAMEGHQYRTHLRLYSAVELSIVGINGHGGLGRKMEW